VWVPSVPCNVAVERRGVGLTDRKTVGAREAGGSIPGGCSGAVYTEMPIGTVYTQIAIGANYTQMPVSAVYTEMPICGILHLLEELHHRKSVDQPYRLAISDLEIFRLGTNLDLQPIRPGTN